MKKRIAQIVFIIEAAALLSGCSCGKMMQRLEKHCPECFQQTSVEVVREVVVPEHKMDAKTDIASLMGGQPLSFEDRKVSLTLLFADDSLSAAVCVKPDTMRITDTLSVSIPCSGKKKADWQSLLACTALLLLLAWLLIYELKKKSE